MLLVAICIAHKIAGPILLNLPSEIRQIIQIYSLFWPRGELLLTFERIIDVDVIRIIYTTSEDIFLSLWCQRTIGL